MKTFIYSLVLFSAIQCKLVNGASPHPECVGSPGTANRITRVYMNSTQKQDGDWVTTYSAIKNTSDPSSNIILDVTHSVTECKGYQLIHIQGILTENKFQLSKLTTGTRGLLFHRSSSDVAITNNGRTLQKTRLNGNGVALTNRPLLDNELFEVRLDKKNSTNAYPFAIGVTTHSPTELVIPDHMNSVKTGQWMLYYDHLYQNASVVFRNYLKVKSFKVGDRLGVLRKSSGHLHFYVNGADQGSAAQNIPSDVYGVFELYGDATQATITAPL